MLCGGGNVGGDDVGGDDVGGRGGGGNRGGVDVVVGGWVLWWVWL